MFLNFHPRELGDQIQQDLRFYIQALFHSPGFSVAALLTLALGIGANTAIFSVVRGVLLKPLNYPDPERVVTLSGGATMTHFEEVRANARLYNGVGAFLGAVENLTLSGKARPEILKAARVSANFLSILGIQPELGRGFRAEEDTPGGRAVAMISHSLWQRRFASDASIVGKTAILGETSYTIIGVLPAGFQFPFPDVDVWVTRPVESSVLLNPESRRLSPVLSIFGRLRPNVTLQQATAELNVLNRQYAAQYPNMLDAKRKVQAEVQPFKERLVADVRWKLWMLFGAVGLVFLIACANVASLLLARASARAPEFALRAALGAGRRRLIAQFLTESILLTGTGGTLGVLLAAWGLSGIGHLAGIDLPRAGEIRVDGLVLLFTGGLALGAGVALGLGTSLNAARPDLAEVLRGNGEIAAKTRLKGIIPWLRPRSLLVVLQVALSVVLLIGAGLLIESVAHLQGVDAGFRTSNVLTAKIVLPSERYDTNRKRAAFYDRLTADIEATTGVSGAAMALTLPMTGWIGSPLQIADRAPVQFNERPIGIVEMVTPDYFRTLGIRLLRGREFSSRDTEDSVPVTIVSESLVRRFWPGYPNGTDPVGRHIFVGANPKASQIVGIVSDTRQSGLDTDPQPEVFFPCAQGAPISAMLAVWTNGDPLRFVNTVRAKMLAIDSDEAISGVQTMEDIVEASEGQRRLLTMLLGVFAGTAALLAAIGIYGVVAYSVVQRTREIGIRRALGARHEQILFAVAGEGLTVTLSGLGLGLIGAFGLTRILARLLFHVSSTDPITFVAVPILFVLVAAVASYLPARRASLVDPMVALRVG